MKTNYPEWFKREHNKAIQSFQELRGEATLARNPFLCRCWIRTRENKDFLGLREIYVPWWAWPFELTHRLIFGSTKIK